MERHKRTDASQGNTMEQYITPVPLPQRPSRSEVIGEDMRVLMNPEEPSHAELLAAIQGSRVALECKIETVAVEVNLLWVDLRKVSDKIKVWRDLLWSYKQRREISFLRSSGGDVAIAGDVGQGGPGEEGLNWRRHSSGLRSRESGLEVT
ncbi:hypothetical protein NDU88_002172 [Pleurodeles waltl]|uniref:Uncharacterized protein n=1 Tax=Pleurodeles waltl TaxID=8319 RepID=A0AAV7SE49_PLEWA|nr:hypothetical protein NDU88_002172 [Pleurodeles waltl]